MSALLRASVLLAGLCVAGPVLAQGGGGGGGGGDGDHRTGGGGAADDANATGPFYYKMDAFLAPIIEKRRVRGYAEIVVTLELASKAAERTVHGKNLPLRDQFLRDLQFQGGMRAEGDPPIDLRRIKARFRALAARLFGDGVVSDVLIDSAIYHGG